MAPPVGELRRRTARQCRCLGTNENCTFCGGRGFVGALNGSPAIRSANVYEHSHSLPYHSQGLQPNSLPQRRQPTDAASTVNARVHATPKSARRKPAQQHTPPIPIDRRRPGYFAETSHGIAQSERPGRSTYLDGSRELGAAARTRSIRLFSDVRQV